MRTIKLAVTAQMRAQIAQVETLEVDLPDGVEWNKAGSRELVRYCVECGCVGEVPKSELVCCKDHRWAFYVPAELAEQARAGFKLTLIRPAEANWSDTEVPEPTPADYRELQAPHDALQTKLHVAQEALKRIGSPSTPTVQKVLIPGSDDLDPITVYLENYEPGKGKITIEVWGKAWSSAWPAMSKRSVEQFFIDSGVPYLVGYLATGIESEILNPDMDELRAKVCRDIFSRRRTHHFDKDMRRELYEQAQVLEISSNACSDYELMAAVYGCEWWRDGLDELKVPNQKYVYLCKVIEAVKEGLKVYIHQQAEAKKSEG